MPKRVQRPTPPAPTLPTPLTDPRQRLLAAQAAQQEWSHLEFVTRLLGTAADRRRERSLERRLAQAHLTDAPTLETFDWRFNAQTIKRTQIEELASCAFLRRQENIIVVGQSGLGKTHIF